MQHAHRSTDTSHTEPADPIYCSSHTPAYRVPCSGLVAFKLMKLSVPEISIFLKLRKTLIFIAHAIVICRLLNTEACHISVSVLSDR